MVADADMPHDEFAEEAQPADAEVGWSGADIEDAYLKALQASDELEWPAAPEAPADAARTDAVGDPSTASPLPAAAVSLDAAAPPVPPEPHFARGGERPTAAGRHAGGRHASAELSNVTPAQILEAVLFVGGDPITSKRLCTVLGGNQEAPFVEQAIDALNAEYAAQHRPYEIRLGEGGYRLVLRPEYESVRNKVYGVGPREVRLSQDALEVLALVAYRQPISHADVEASGKKNAGNLLRQLLRRELVAITRIDKSRNGVQYHTTPRFLSLFGLGSLDELPQADALNLR